MSNTTTILIEGTFDKPFCDDLQFLYSELEPVNLTKSEKTILSRLSFVEDNLRPGNLMIESNRYPNINDDIAHLTLIQNLNHLKHDESIELIQTIMNHHVNLIGNDNVRPLGYYYNEDKNETHLIMPNFSKYSNQKNSTIVETEFACK